MKKGKKAASKSRASRASRPKTKPKPKAKPKPKVARKSTTRGPRAVVDTEAYEPSSLQQGATPIDKPTVPDNDDLLDTESGDLEGLSRHEEADSESVEELVDEGQDLEGELVEAVEEAPDPDKGDLRPHTSPRRRATPFKDRNRL